MIIETRSCLLAIAAAILAVAVVTPAAAQVVGRAAAVNPAAQSNGGTKVIQLGSEIIHKERIQTSGQGSVQLLFVDKTSLNIGPNSDLVIDEFVYNPSTGSGRMAMTLGKGVLRFVGGQTSHTEGATIKTPTATLGIRGGVNTTSYDPAGKLLQTINLFGATSVEANGQTILITRPGFGTQVGVGGALPPFRIPLETLNALNAALTSKGTQGGGAPSKPSNQTAQKAGSGLANSGFQPNDFSRLNGTPYQTTEFVQFAQQGNQIQQQQNAQDFKAKQDSANTSGETIVFSGFVGGVGQSSNAATGAPDGGPYALFGVNANEVNPAGKLKGTVIAADVSSPGGGSGLFFFEGNCAQTDCGQFAISAPLTGLVNNGAAIQNANINIRTATAADTAAFPAVSFCQCEFVRWGFWSAQFDHTEPSGTVTRDMINHGVFTTGRPTAVAEIPTVGLATYSGHAIAAISNGGSPFFAASNFTNQVNFGNGTGVVSIPSLNGRSYTGTVAFPGGVNAIGGLLQTTAGSSDPSILLLGQFYGPNAREMGGAINIQPGSRFPNYIGSGIFAARRP